MNEYAPGASPAHAGPSSLRGDERGAILVLGIFMAACVVGMLWYLAGLGTTVLYKERMQESSDAVAFSAAVLHARGMNLLVLINLIMACILGIRVAMKVVQVSAAAIGVIALFIPGGQGVAGQAFSVAARMEMVIRRSERAIDGSLKGLSKAQGVIAKVVPGASLVGAIQVGQKYQPVVFMAEALNLELAHNPRAGLRSLTSLPVVEGTEDRLCREAGNAVTQIAVAIMHLPLDPALAEQLGGLLGRAVEEGGAYFCEMGNDTGKQPDFSKDNTSAVGDACKKDKAAAEEQKKADEKAGKPTTEFDEEKCKKDKEKQIQDEKNKAGYKNQPQQRRNKNGQGMTPKKVDPAFKNGSIKSQFLAMSHGRTDMLNLAPVGVKAGAWASQQDINVPQIAGLSFAQAEYFFDCKGKWTADACNGTGESAMWRFRWRARLVRFDVGHQAAQRFIQVFLAAITAIEGMTRTTGGWGTTFNNLQLRRDVLRAMRDPIIH